MYCYKCGKKQPDSGRFCFHCGASLSDLDLDQGAPVSTHVSRQKDEDAKPSGRPEMSGHDNPRAESGDFESRPSAGSEGLSAGVHPWRRFFAHTIDVWAFGLAGSFAVGFLAYSLFPSSTESLNALFENPLVALALVYVVMIPIESALLASTGTTLGKALFGIRVLNSKGGLLTFNQAIERGVNRWARAEGLGLPIVSLVAYALAYGQLKKQGFTNYDRSLSVSVRHTVWSAGRAIMVFVATIVIFLIVIMVNAVLTEL